MQMMDISTNEDNSFLVLIGAFWTKRYFCR